MQLVGATELERRLYDVVQRCEQEMPASELETTIVTTMCSAMNELQRLRNLIGVPPEGSHPDEWNPRDATWHQERLNWISEVNGLRECVRQLEGKPL